MFNINRNHPRESTSGLAGPSSYPQAGGRHGLSQMRDLPQHSQPIRQRQMDPLPSRPLARRPPGKQWQRSQGYGRTDGDHLRLGSSSGPVSGGMAAPGRPMVTKSAYRDFLDLPTQDSDEPRDRGRRSQMSTISVRSAKGAAPTPARTRLAAMSDRYHIVNGKLVRMRDSALSDEEDSDEDSLAISTPIAAPAQTGRKAAKSIQRKAVPVVTPSPEPPAIRMSEAPPSPPRVKRIIRKREIIVISSDSEEEDPQGDRDGFLAAAAPFRVGIRLQLHKRMPFLVRNLRKSFVRICQLKGINVHPPDEPARGVKYTYRFCDPRDAFPGEVSSARWSEFWQVVAQLWCPFCDLLGCFDTEEMLRYHLTREHRDVQVSWRAENGLPHYTFRLPEPAQAEESDESEEEEEIGEEPPAAPESSDGELEYIDPPPRPPSPSRSPPDSPVMSRSPTPAAAEANSHQNPASPMQIDDSDTGPGTTSPFSRDRATTSTSATTLATASTKALSVTPKHEYEEVVLPREATPQLPPPRTPRTGLSATGELVPPPILNPLGPAAEPPLESCRPGGPKIYDLLNDLPVEPYGVLAWTIVDREEEIFEFADILDEDKVMNALWNRWIFFNRVKFVFNRGDETCRAGVQRFIDDNYVMIHRAAGWAALRSFLIVLTGNRFVNLRDVLKLLEHYDKLVKRKEWYN